MTEAEIAVMEEIVNRKGNCLDGKLCMACPFRLECLPPFIVPDKEPLSDKKRCSMALTALSTLVFEGVEYE